jgi:hypothetical protein
MADGVTEFHAEGTPYSTIQYEFSGGASLEVATDVSFGGNAFMSIDTGITNSKIATIPGGSTVELIRLTVSSYVSGTCTVYYRAATLLRK